jgi:hypothetical protein
MTTAQKVEFTQTVLMNVSQNQATRLHRGLQLREEMHSVLESGSSSSSYRYEWIQKSVVRLLGELEAIGADFNREHREDRCSVTDYMDILQSTLATLKAG